MISEEQKDSMSKEIDMSIKAEQSPYCISSLSTENLAGFWRRRGEESKLEIED